MEFEAHLGSKSDGLAKVCVLNLPTLLIAYGTRSYDYQELLWDLNVALNVQ